MKRTSLLSTVVALSIVLSIPAFAFSHGNYSQFSLLDVTDAVTLNHRGNPYHGGHGGCW